MTMADERSFDDTTLLIGLGPPRTGSRWLSNYFTGHSEILMSPVRVLHYFDPTDRYNIDFENTLRSAEGKLAARVGAIPDPPPPAIAALRDRVRMNSDPHAYLDFFRKRWSGEKAFADVTPSYYIAGRDAYARMRDCHPRVRFLLVLRNPIDRLWSELRMARPNDPGYDPIKRLDGLLASTGPAWRLNYATTLTDLDAVIPSGDVKVCFFEHLFDMNAIAELCAFCGVGAEPADIGSAMNQGEEVQLDAERRGRFFAKLEPVYRFVHERYDGRLPVSWLADKERFGVRH
jgi:Sulfotransferase family